jgi:O-antigen/teichoic acid export membrane protein
MAGNIIAQAINFFSAPILTRLYTPYDMGIFSFVTSTVAVIAIITGLGYEHAIVLSRNRRQAWDLVAICLILAITFALGLACILHVGADYGHLLLDLSIPPDYLHFIALGIFLFAIHQIAIFWWTWEKSFLRIAFGQVFNQTLSAAVKIGAPLTVASVSPVWLIGGYLSGLGGSFLMLAAKFPVAGFWKYLQRYPLDSLVQTAKHYKTFPQFHPWARFLDTFSRMMPIFLFASWYEAEIVGFYGLAFIVLAKPASVISLAVGRVFYQNAAAHKDDLGYLSRQLKKTTLILLAAGIIPFSLIAVKGEFLFGLIFGQAWSAAGFFAKLLAPALFVSFILPPANHLIMVRNLLRFRFFFSLVILVLRFGSIFIAGYIFKSEPWVCVLGFSLVGALCNLFLIGYCLFNLANHSGAREISSSISF